MARKQALTQRLLQAASKLKDETAALDFSQPIEWVYCPLEYAWSPYDLYIRHYAKQSCRVLFVGMNPGPWGMAQTGIPFGEVQAVREFLGIDAKVDKPKREHPKRPIQGFECPRSEVSGRRLWGLFQQRYETADRFFDEHFVVNYCPLIFMEESARNITPDKIPVRYREPLEASCDRHLVAVIEALAPEWLVGVGAFAEACAQRVVQQHDIQGLEIGRILHPSPASPAANRDWAGTATAQLKELAVW